MAKSVKKAGVKPSAEVLNGPNPGKIPVEEVIPPASLLPAAQQLSPEEQGLVEIKKFDISRTAIAQKKKEWATVLKPGFIKGLEDKEGYKKVQEAWQWFRNKRIGVDKTHKGMKADYLTITRIMDKEKNELTSLLEEGETPAGAELERIDNLKKEKEREQERIEAAALQARVEELNANGMTFNGSYYVIGKRISMDIVTLKGLPPEEYTKFLAMVKEENQSILEAMLEAEKLAQAEKEAQEALRIKNEDDARKLRQEQEELQRQKDELKLQQDALKKERTTSRSKMLEALGMTFNYGSSLFQFGTLDFGRITVARSEVEDIENKAFEIIYEDAEKRISLMKVQQAEKDTERKMAEEKERQDLAEKKRLADEAKARFIYRKNQIFDKFEAIDNGILCVRKPKFQGLASISFTYTELRDLPEDEWETLLSKRTAGYKGIIDAEFIEERRIKELQEQARKAALTEIERVKEWIIAMQAVPEPSVNNLNIRDTVHQIQEHMEGVLEKIDGQIGQLN